MTVTLTDFDPDKKILVIKALRAMTGLGLQEAKNLVDNLPTQAITVKECLSVEEAESIIQTLEEAGGIAEYN